MIGSVTNPADRNVIGAHGGSYSLYRALAISARALNPLSRPDLRNTHPTAGDRPASAMVRARPDRLARSIRAYGRRGLRRRDRRRGSTSARRSRSPRRASTCPRSSARWAPRALPPTAASCITSGDISVTKIAVDPVWHLPGIAVAVRLLRGRAAPHAVRADRRHVPGARDAARHERVPAADRQHHRLRHRRRRRA